MNRPTILILLALATQTHAVEIRPETLVKFPKGAIACITKDALSEVVGHYLRGEITKGDAMMIANNEASGQCIMLSPKRSYKVISAEYNAQDRDMGLIELVGAGNKSGTGAWAFTIGAEPAK